MAEENKMIDVLIKLFGIGVAIIGVFIIFTNFDMSDFGIQNMFSEYGVMQIIFPLMTSLLYLFLGLFHLYVGLRTIQVRSEGIKTGFLVFGLIIIFSILMSIFVSSARQLGIILLTTYLPITLILFSVWKYKFKELSLMPSKKAIVISSFTLVIIFLFCLVIVPVLVSPPRSIHSYDDSMNEITRKLNDAELSFATMATTEGVLVGSEVIIASALAESTYRKLEKEQLCFLKSETLANDFIDVGNGSLFKNKGGKVKVKFSVVCDHYAELQEDLDVYFEGEAPDLEYCDSFKSLEQTETACAIIVRNPKD